MKLKHKIRLFLGQPLEAPFADFIPALVALAVLLIAGSLLVWSDAFDTLLLSRDRAEAREIVVASAEVAGADSYSPRLEIVSEDGGKYVLLESQVGDRLNAVAEELEPGDGISLRLSRKGRVLEVLEGDQVHLDFGESVASAVKDVVISTLVAVCFDLIALFLLLRAWVLKLNRKGSFRFGPAN